MPECPIDKMQLKVLNLYLSFLSNSFKKRNLFEKSLF